MACRIPTWRWRTCPTDRTYRGVPAEWRRARGAAARPRGCGFLAVLWLPRGAVAPTRDELTGRSASSARSCGFYSGGDDVRSVRRGKPHPGRRAGISVARLSQSSSFLLHPIFIKKYVRQLPTHPPCRSSATSIFFTNPALVLRSAQPALMSPSTTAPPSPTSQSTVAPPSPTPQPTAPPSRVFPIWELR